MVEIASQERHLEELGDDKDQEAIRLIENGNEHQLTNEINKNKYLQQANERVNFSLQEKREVVSTIVQDVIENEVKKYDFDATVVPEIIKKFYKKYDNGIKKYDQKKLNQLFQKSVDGDFQLVNIFGRDVTKEMNDIIADYNKIAILNMFKSKLESTDKKTIETIESMLDETEEKTINKLGFVLNYGTTTKERVLSDLIQKIQTRNTKHPDIPLVKFDDATISSTVNEKLQPGKNGQGTRETKNETIAISTFTSENSLNETIDKALNTIHTSAETSPSDTIKFQVPVDFFSNIAQKLQLSTSAENTIAQKIKEKIFQKAITSGRGIQSRENIKIEKLASLSSHINITREGIKGYRTVLGDKVFEVPVAQKNNIEKRIATLFKENPGENTSIYISVPTIGSQDVINQIHDIQKTFAPKKIQINLVPNIESIEVSGEIAEYGDFSGKLNLGYNEIGNHEKIANVLPKELTDILNDTTSTIIGGEIYGSASYQHTEYTPNAMLSSREATNNSFVLENKTEDNKQVKQLATEYKESNWDKEPAGSVTNNPPLAKDRALSFLEYIYSIDGGKKIQNLKNIKISYGVNGPTLEETKQKVKTTNNKDTKLIPEFEPYQYANLHLQYKKTKKLDTEVFPLTKTATSSEGFQIHLKSKTDKRKTSTKKRENFFKNKENTPSWQNFSCGPST